MIIEKEREVIIIDKRDIVKNKQEEKALEIHINGQNTTSISKSLKKN